MVALLIAAHNDGAFRLRIVQSMTLLTPALASFSVRRIGAVLARVLPVFKVHQFFDTRKTH